MRIVRDVTVTMHVANPLLRVLSMHCLKSLRGYTLGSLKTEVFKIHKESSC